MYDVAALIGIGKKRAIDLMNKCYATIAQLQKEDNTGHLEKVIPNVRKIGRTEAEIFYTGMYLGRIIQINESAREGIEPFLEEHMAQLEKAMDELKDHPEFG